MGIIISSCICDTEEDKILDSPITPISNESDSLYLSSDDEDTYQSIRSTIYKK